MHEYWWAKWLNWAVVPEDLCILIAVFDGMVAQGTSKGVVAKLACLLDFLYIQTQPHQPLQLFLVVKVMVTRQLHDSQDAIFTVCGA